MSWPGFTRPLCPSHPSSQPSEAHAGAASFARITIYFGDCDDNNDSSSAHQGERRNALFGFAGS